MVKNTILFVLLFLCGNSYASRFDTTVRIKNLSYVATGQIIFDFDNLNPEGFLTPIPNGVTKLRFDFLNWPPDSRNRSFLEKLIFWKNKPDYQIEMFELCINWMIKNYKEDRSFRMGQVGGGQFGRPAGVEDQLIVPYILPIFNDDKTIASCEIDLG